MEAQPASENSYVFNKNGKTENKHVNMPYC